MDAPARSREAIDLLFYDEEVWTRVIRLVQAEVVKSTVGHTDWEMPDDIAEDIICTVVSEFVAAQVR